MGGDRGGCLGMAGASASASASAKAPAKMVFHHHNVHNGQHADRFEVYTVVVVVVVVKSFSGTRFSAVRPQHAPIPSCPRGGGGSRGALGRDGCTCAPILKTELALTRVCAMAFRPLAWQWYLASE